MDRTGAGTCSFLPISPRERCPFSYVCGGGLWRGQVAIIRPPWSAGWTEIETEGAAVRAREKRNEGNFDAFLNI